MSHKATNWAISQRGISPTGKLLLWHLADAHNSHTGRCDPSQERLAYECEISSATLNRKLAGLEANGFIQRQKRYDKRKKTQLRTFYILGFDIPETQNTPSPDSQNETRKADSQKQQKPTLKNAESRLSNRESNPVREPVREPCAEAQKSGFFEFWEAYPRNRAELTTQAAFEAAVKSGVSPEWIIRSAKAYAKEQYGNEPKYICYSDKWLKDGRWQDFPESSKPKEKMDAAAFWANAIITGGFVTNSCFAPSLVREMLARGLVTVGQLKKGGISP